MNRQVGHFTPIWMEVDKSKNMAIVGALPVNYDTTLTSNGRDKQAYMKQKAKTRRRMVQKWSFMAGDQYYK